jgi:preprotein translocase subunit SecF
VLSSIMFASPLLSFLKDGEPRIKSHNARVLARRANVRSGDVARGERKRAVAAGEVPADDVPAEALAGSTPRPGARPTAKRNTNRGGRPGGSGNRPSGGSKRR